VIPCVDRRSPGALLAGDPRHAALGTLISAEAARRIRALVDDAVEKGARIAAGGGLDGAVMQATVIDGVKPTMKLYREESFGPVVAVIRAEDEETTTKRGLRLAPSRATSVEMSRAACH
jgi:acyl-CoA reductase-like NAD-dependent aldehyde dehydrogenase